MNHRSTLYILAALVLGVIVGDLCHQGLDPALTSDVAGYFALLSEIFLRLIKMIIAPLIFATLVDGLGGMGDARAVARVGGRAIGWFVLASLGSLLLGLLFANLLEPGAALELPLPDAGTATNLKTSALNLKEFIAHLFPRNIVEAMAGNEILQILLFALFFGVALARAQGEKARALRLAIGGLVPVMLQVTQYVMRFAPLGVFGAVASAVSLQGLGILAVYGRFAGGFYLTLFALWAALVGAGFLVLGRDVFRLVDTIRGPMLLGFATATSEAAYPRLLERLERFGVPERVAGFILPLGYSFNLDGSMIYTSFVSIFISQAYHQPLGLGQQALMLLVLMVSSKGIAGVPRASLVVVAAVLPLFHLPEAGILLILGIDHFLDMGRSATNILGNSIATAVVARWEGALVPASDADTAMAPPAATAGPAADKASGARSSPDA